MLPDTKSPPADATDTPEPATGATAPTAATAAMAATAATVPPDRAGAAVRKPPDSRTFATGWMIAAIVAVLVAAALSVVIARGTDLTTAHRAAAAGTALLVVAALAVVAQAILLWHQARMVGATKPAPAEPTLAFRRRGLKAAIIGQDGRASTSKTQVVLWTAAGRVGAHRSAPAGPGMPQRKPKERQWPDGEDAPHGK